MNFETATDFEINMVVATKLGLKYIHTRDGKVCYQTQHGGSLVVDFCNNPSDAMPIILENRISFHLEEGDEFVYNGVEYDEWNGSVSRYHYTYDIENINSKPLRSAMILFLIMSGEN